LDENLSVHKPNITKYRHDLEVIRMVAEQVKKDFSFHSIEIKFSGNEMTAFTELKAQITPLVSNLFLTNKNQLLQLLYRIDVSENDWRKILEINDIEVKFEKLAEIILEREFIKVLIRKLYSKK